MPFDDALRLRIRGLTEVGPEPMMGGEPHVGAGRHDPVGDHPALQTPHPVGQHHPGHPTQDLEALREQPQRGVCALVTGEADEPHPRPGQHRAEHVQPTQHAPVDNQVLARGPHRRAAAAMMLGAPHRLLRGHQRRKLRADPAYPPARAAGSSRFALIRPFVLSTRSATSSVTGS